MFVSKPGMFSSANACFRRRRDRRLWSPPPRVGERRLAGAPAPGGGGWGGGDLRDPARQGRRGSRRRRCARHLLRSAACRRLVIRALEPRAASPFRWGQHPRGDHVRAGGPGAFGCRARWATLLEPMPDVFAGSSGATPRPLRRAPQRGGVRRVRRRAAPDARSTWTTRRATGAPTTATRAAPPTRARRRASRCKAAWTSEIVARPRARDEHNRFFKYGPTSAGGALRGSSGRCSTTACATMSRTSRPRRCTASHDRARSACAAQPPAADGRRRGPRRRRAPQFLATIRPARAVRGQPPGLVALPPAGPAPARGATRCSAACPRTTSPRRPRQLDRGVGGREGRSVFLKKHLPIIPMTRARHRSLQHPASPTRRPTTHSTGTELDGHEAAGARPCVGREVITGSSRP